MVLIATETKALSCQPLWNCFQHWYVHQVSVSFFLRCHCIKTVSTNEAILYPGKELQREMNNLCMYKAAMSENSCPIRAEYVNYMRNTHTHTHTQTHTEPQLNERPETADFHFVSVSPTLKKLLPSPVGSAFITKLTSSHWNGRTATLHSGTNLAEYSVKV